MAFQIITTNVVNFNCASNEIKNRRACNSGIDSRLKRRTQRLVRAAYGVGRTHSWFLDMDQVDQAIKVEEWVKNAFYWRAVRLGQIAPM
jgi:hypothetical protein